MRNNVSHFGKIIPLDFSKNLIEAMQLFMFVLIIIGVFAGLRLAYMDVRILFESFINV